MHRPDLAAIPVQLLALRKVELIEIGRCRLTDREIGIEITAESATRCAAAAMQLPDEIPASIGNSNDIVERNLACSCLQMHLCTTYID